MTRRRVYSNLYPQVCSIDNLYLAWRKASKGKRGRAGARLEFCNETHNGRCAVRNMNNPFNMNNNIGLRVMCDNSPRPAGNAHRQS